MRLLVPMPDRLLARWPLLVAIAFCVYASVLLGTGFRSQQQLTLAADARLVAGAARQAEQVADFLAERRANVSELAEAPEIETYLTNKALGMSLRYGLGASLDAIEQRMRRWSARNALRGKEIFSRIAFVDSDGTTLAKIGSDGGAVAPVSGLAAAAVLSFDLERRRIGVTVPVIRKDVVVGAIMALCDIGMLSGRLRSETETPGMPRTLLTAAGENLGGGQGQGVLDPVLGLAFAGLPPNRVVPVADVVSTGQMPDWGDMVVVRTPLPGLDLSLITLASNRDVYGHITSRALLCSLSVLPPLVLVAALMLDQTRRRNRALSDRNLALSEEISRRQAVEAALRDSEERFRATFEQAAVGMAHTAPTGRWLRVNDKLCTITGFTREELLAATFQDITHPDDLEPDLELTRALLAGEIATFSMEKRYLRKDGSVIWIDLTVTLLRDAGGGPKHFISVIQDISERKRAETELRNLTGQLEVRVREAVAAREAAQARAAHAERIQALGQLAGGIAHDFNNVLQAVQGAATLIERRPKDEAGVRRLARVVIEAAGRGASITRRLLALGRRGDLRAEMLDVAALFGDLSEIFAYTLGASIEVKVRFDAGLPTIFADKGQLETVLVNLATNARDAMPEGGRLTLVAETEIVSPDHPAHPAGLAPGGYVRLSVIDTGAGMDAATLARVGEPFFTTKASGSGTGLGLPMAKGFAAQSGGALGIESDPGRGTTVTLWLPACGVDRTREAAAQPGEETAPSASGQVVPSSRVLVVDDEELVREMLAEILQETGFDVLVAASGAEALDLLAAGEAVDALLTDLSMPGMDGIAVIRAAQERRPGLPALLLTGYAGDGAALAVGGAVSGTFTLLRKPIRAQDLVDRVQALLAAQENAAH